MVNGSLSEPLQFILGHEFVKLTLCIVFYLIQQTFVNGVLNWNNVLIWICLVNLMVLKIKLFFYKDKK